MEGAPQGELWRCDSGLHLCLRVFNVCVCVCVCRSVFMCIHVEACTLRTQGGECVFSVFDHVLLIPGIQQGV